jgi:hypothetical protein
VVAAAKESKRKEIEASVAAVKLKQEEEAAVLPYQPKQESEAAAAAEMDRYPHRRRTRVHAIRHTFCML